MSSFGRSGRVWAALALGSLWLGGCAGDPQPAPEGHGPETQGPETQAPEAQGGEARPGASPRPAAGGASRAPKREALRFQASESGLLISGPEGGFSCTTPGSASAGPGGGEGALAYELQARRPGWALRIRRDRTPPGASPQEQAETLLYARALRKPSEVTPFRPATCARWGVEAASAGTYPLGKGEAWERVLVLIRGPQALVLWETVDPRLGRALVTELNGRFYASFRWGGPPRVMARTPSLYVDAEARLSPRGAQIAQELAQSLPEDDLLRAEGLLSKVAYSAADPPDEALDVRDRELLGEKLGALSEAAATRLRLELSERVRTPRDLRGLHQVLDAALE